MRFLLPLLAILVCWGAFGLHHMHTFVLGLGSIHEPTYDALQLALVLSAVGIPATYLVYRIALPALGADGNLLKVLRQALHEGDRRAVLWGLGLLGALLPIFIRKLILNDVPLTDDEASYRFGAELLAGGHLWLPSPHMPVFFDNGFIVNDGKMYSQYFLGWPALLAIGVLLGIPGLINPILSGCTVVRPGGAWRRCSTSARRSSRSLRPPGCRTWRPVSRSRSCCMRSTRWPITTRAGA
jgi:hypothetical protein